MVVFVMSYVSVDKMINSRGPLENRRLHPASSGLLTGPLEHNYSSTAGFVLTGSWAEEAFKLAFTQAFMRRLCCSS